MPIISKVGRRSPATIALIAAIYLTLSGGAVTMIYPFILMLAGSVRGEADQYEMTPIPTFLTDETALFHRYIETKYNEDINEIAASYRSAYYNYAGILRPTEVNEEAVADWRQFLADRGLPDEFLKLGHLYGTGKRPEMHRRFYNYVRVRFNDDLSAYNEAVGASTPRWLSQELSAPKNQQRFYRFNETVFDELLLEFRRQQPSRYLYPATVGGDFLIQRVFTKYGRSNLDFYNERHNTALDDFNQVDLPRRVPPVPDFGELEVDPLRIRVNLEEARPAYIMFVRRRYQDDLVLLEQAYVLESERFEDIPWPKQEQSTTPAQREDWRDFIEYIAEASWLHVPNEPAYRQYVGMRTTREDWEAYVRNSLNIFFIKLDQGAGSYWQSFLRLQDSDEAAALQRVNTAYQTNYVSFTQIPLSARGQMGPAEYADFEAFLQARTDQGGYMLPADLIELDGPEYRFQDFLADKYLGEIHRLNRHHGRNYSSFGGVRIPSRDEDLTELRENRGSFRWEILTRSYKEVWEYLAGSGRGLINTIIFCFLAITTTLLVNPLAAYAMSRYQLPSTYKILLFLMATMAFPAEVTMIPAFLLLKNFNLLNTFAALVLPGIANGYMIFLLKGFFDSLPKELYESATLDGASEIRIFFQITMALSKPILAVLALNAFMASYGAFVHALLVCQDERMWTLMVWIFQLQQTASSSVVFASLVIAGIPTFLVFLICQNVIMRGIVVPVER